MRAWRLPSLLTTYATIIDLNGMHEDSLIAAVLGSLSVFYVAIGALCLPAAFMQPPHDVRIASVMPVAIVLRLRRAAA